MTVEYLKRSELSTVLDLLTPTNRRICLVMLSSGLRVSDVVGLTTEQIKKQRFTVKEIKTKKSRRVFLPKSLQAELLPHCGKVWAFEGRTPEFHRSRQAVWKDLKRASRACRLPANVGAHSMRKDFAVEYYAKHGLKKTQAELLHDNPAVTLLYCLSDKLREDKSR